MLPPFPTDIQEFDSDDRISYSKLDKKFIAVYDDGSEYEFDTENKTWLLIDEEPVDHDHLHEHSSDEASMLAHTSKRKSSPGNGPEAEMTKPSRPPKKQKAPPPPRQNTAVYVTGLPLDTTVTEVYDLFSRKGGVIAEEIDSGAPRIKLYTNDEGKFKGDALVVFFKPQSVEMAIMLLDDTDFRISASGARDGRIRVQAADSSYKKVQYDQDKSSDSNGQQSERGTQKSSKDRQKIIKKTQKLDAKLADWDDDERYAMREEVVTKWDKTVILRHMFTLKELEEDPVSLLEIKEDIRDECAKLGTVTNVVLYDQEQDGIVSVKFRDPEAAQQCIRTMHGRNFDGRVVDASLSSGKEKFRKSDKDQHAGDSD